MKYPDQLDSSPKTLKDSVIKLLQTIGLNYLLDEQDRHIEQDLIALYRISCMAGVENEVRSYFEYQLDEDTLNHLEKQAL